MMMFRPALSARAERLSVWLTVERIDKFACAVAAVAVTAFWFACAYGFGLLFGDWRYGLLIVAGGFVRASYDVLRKRHAAENFATETPADKAGIPQTGGRGEHGG